MAETTNPFVALLGSTPLQSHTDTTVEVASLSNKKHVLLYFSAHWCPPCRGFTPQLAEYYKSHHEKFNFEIVFVSSDKEEKAFDEYWGEMPWLALPYTERTTKGKLSSKYKVSGIPSLVVLDSQGEIVNKNARGNVTSDPEGFPWAVKTLTELLTGTVINQAGDSIQISSFNSYPALGIYFSAHWCGPCRGFTPKLSETYKKIKDAGKKFEILFASSDRDDHSFKEYFAEMPWLAFPFKDKRISELSEYFDVEGIPTLVILDPSTGKVIEAEGREAVSGDPAGNNFPWYPKATNELQSHINQVNNSACLIYVDTDLNADIIKTLETVGTFYWGKWKAEGKVDMPLRFLHGKPEGLGERVLTYANVKGPKALFILNIPSQLKTISTDTTITEESLKAFVDGYISGSLKSIGAKE